MTATVEKSAAKRFGISSFVLHILAMVFMLCDHLWGTYLGQYDILANVGRIAFPLFAFMLVEGFMLTSDRKKYALRLLVFALISEIPFNLMMGSRVFYPLDQNVLWTFLLAFALMSIFEKIKQLRHLVPRLLLYTLSVFVFYFVGMFTFVDYYGYGILIVALFYFTRTAAHDELWKKILCGVLQAAGILYICAEMIQGIVIPINLFGLEFEIHRQSIALLSLPLIWLYNGKQGLYNKFVKYFYYLFYPLHILLLALPRVIL